MLQLRNSRKHQSWRFGAWIGSAILAGTLGFIASPAGASAQDTPPPPPDAQTAPPTQDQGPAQGSAMAGPRGRRPSVDDQVRHLTSELSLSADQQAKVKSALEQQRQQMEELRKDSSLSQDDRGSKMRTIHESTTTQIKSVLDEGQAKKYDAMLAKQHNHMRPPQGEAPPPPQ